MAARIHKWIKLCTANNGTNECWIWTGPTNRHGYASVTIDKRTTTVHRVFYEFFVAPIPEGLEIDHLCRRRGCMNPFHMEAVTHKTNMERAIGVGQYDRSLPKGPDGRRTHCSRGHALVAGNTFSNGKGGFQCRTCLARRKLEMEDEVR